MRLDTWSVRDGLPSRVINSVVQTHDGFIWLATYAGLIRFDGVSFDIYDTQNTPSLPSNLITTLLVSREGDLWVGTEWGGFGRFKDGKFIRYQAPDNQWSRVRAMAESPDGSIWIAGWGDQPLRCVSGNRVTVYKDLHTTDPGPDALLPLADGSVICGMPWDVPKIVSPTGKISNIWSDHHFSYPCSALLRDRDGSIWYGNGRKGIVHIQGARYTEYSTANGLASNISTTFYQDRTGRVWVGTNDGVDVWNGKSFSYFGKIDGLYDSSVACVTQDAEGNVWVGSGVGLNRFAVTKLQPYTLSVGSDTASGETIAPDGGSDGMWCGTNLGMWHLSPYSTVQCNYLSKLESHFEGVAPDGAGGIVTWTDHAQNSYEVWDIAPNKKGAALNPASLESTDAKPAVTCKKVEIHWSIYAFVPVTGGVLAFGQHAVSMIEPGRIAWTKPMPSEFVFNARRDRLGTIWIGSTAGLVRWSNGVATVMNAGLPTNAHVLGIDAADPKRLWLATDHGLAEFQNGRSTLFGPESGLEDTNLFEILQDDRQTLWIGSNSGLMQIRIADIDAYAQHRARQIAYRLFGAADGIRSFPDDKSCAVSTDGKLWFTGDAGVTTVDPNGTIINPVPPPVEIEDASLDGVPVSMPNIETFKPGEGRLSIRFAANSFQAPERVLFRYKLEGLDSNWTDVGNRRNAFYPFLPPGSYRFVVIACNNDGIWNTTGASISFVLRPHYYETGWFKALCTTIALAVLIALYYMRVRQIVRHSRELEQKVSDRTAELVESNEQLQTAQATLARHYEELAQRNGELEAVQLELKAHNEELRATRETLAEANAHLEALATTDGLTSLKNHRSFQVQLEAEWERYGRYGHPVSVIMLDVDRFKQYNDTFGHPGGDEVLRRVSEILTAMARDCDFVARYGGEEFVVIAPETDEEGAIKLAERMRVAIERADWTLRSVTASFGVATASITMHSGADLLASSDAALLYAKTRGRNQVVSAAALDSRHAVPTAPSAPAAD